MISNASPIRLQSDGPALAGPRSACIAAACNDESVLQSCLLASPQLPTADVLLAKNPKSASIAYNQLIASARTDLVILAHQDLYLPPGWTTQLAAALSSLNQTDPDWGVLGLYGVAPDGCRRGWIYSSGLKRVVGAPFLRPEPVRTLDEVLLIVRRSSELRFDDTLPGFHMYGTDICLSAERMGMKNYVVPCFALHNSNGIQQLPKSFWHACLHARRKWRDRLPIITPCVRIDTLMAGAFRQMLWRYLQYSLRSTKVGSRVPDPASLYQELLGTGQVPECSQA